MSTGRDRAIYARIVRLEADVEILKSANNSLINEIRALNGLERVDFDAMEREAKENHRRRMESMLSYLGVEAGGSDV